MHMTYLLLLLGFVLLVKGADYFVSGSSAIARYFHIPAFIIGLTIVALGTSLPEAAISVAAAMREANGITIGNALGSNLFNLLVVLGAASVIKTCPVSKSTLRFEYPLSIFAAALILLLCASRNASGMILSRLDGLLLLAVLIAFLVMTVRRAAEERRGIVSGKAGAGEEGKRFRELLAENEMEAERGVDKAGAGEGAKTFREPLVKNEAEQKHGINATAYSPELSADGMKGCGDEAARDLQTPQADGGENCPQAVSLPKGVIFTIAGAAAIIFGGDIVVDSATTIAEAFGIDETLIGLTVVAFGTSLPELVTSVVAAAKGETDIAVGNVIGSNLFNLLMVLGLSVFIHPIRVSLFSVYDLSILIIASLIVLVPLARKQALTRGWGILLLAMYGAYLAYIIMRTM